MAKVWLVTGSASGLGRHIADAVLASGDRLVATARDPRRLADLVAQYGEQVRTAPLDVADEQAAYAAVQVAVDAFGRLDVVVNNAGYGDIAPFEQLSAERFKALVDTNFYGVVYVTRAALPIMRKQQSGCILQISSVGGRLALPGSAAYHAAKWAVGGFTEALAQEVAPFGVKMCALEPGGMRTNWGVRANQDTPDLLPEYAPSVGVVIKSLSRSGARRRAIRPRWRRSSCVWRPVIVSRPISCWAAMPCSTRAKLRRLVPPRQTVGETSASRQTSTRRGPCQHCDSERRRGAPRVAGITSTGWQTSVEYAMCSAIKVDPSSDKHCAAFFTPSGWSRHR